jgi:iron complex outermembrane recepter protein
MHRLKWTIHCGAACMSVLVASGGRAAPAAAAGSGEVLEEIIVTAEKQSENLQKTAAQVTAIPAVELIQAGVTDLRQAQMIVPAVRFQAEGNNTQVFVRGVGANLDFPNLEPNVAFNFAGIYLPREATSASFFDVAQLEILPGSQGTLYGRSAIGGTIVMSPTKPDFNDDGQTLLEAGNYSAVHAAVTQNIKLSDSLALRAAIDYAYNNGYMTTGSYSKNDASARLSMIYNPSERLSIYLYGQTAQKSGKTENLVNKGLDANYNPCEMCFFHSDAWDDTRVGAFAPPFPTGTTKAERNHYRTDMVGGEIDYKFENMTLSYLPSFLYLDARPLYWLSAIQSTNTAHYNQFEQELRLSSNQEKPWKWLLGLSYYNSRNSGSEYLFTNCGAPGECAPFLPANLLQTNIELNRLRGSAAFGQVTYSLTDSTRLTAGARVSDTKRDARGVSVPAPPFLGKPYVFDKSYSHLDWKVGIEHDVGSSIMLYGVVQTGYQSGTFNAVASEDSPSGTNEVKPEQLRSYTIGLKSRWLDDRLQINNEIYYYDFHNLIIQAYSVTEPYNFIFNGAKVTVKGDQLDILARVFRQDQANLNISYSRARNVDVFDPHAGHDWNGLAPAYTPDWVVQAGYTHNIALGRGNLRLHANGRYESKWWADYIHNLGTEQTGNTKFDANVTYETDKWSIGAWIKNISNKAVIAATAAAGIPGPATAYMEDPRTYGVRVSVKY